MENQSEHKCLNCGHYKALYTKTESGINAEKAGSCFKCGQIKHCGDTCSHWCAISGYRILLDRQRVAQGLFSKIAEIRYILQELENVERK